MRAANVLLVCSMIGACSRTGGGVDASVPQPFHVDEPASFITDADRSERIASESIRSIRERLIEGIKQQHFDVVASALDPGFSGRMWTPIEWREEPSGGLQIARSEPSRVLQREPWARSLQQILNGSTAIERASWQVFLSLANIEGTSTRVFQKAHFDIGALAEGHRRIELHATVAAILVKEGNTPWMIEKLDFIEGTWTKSELPQFEDISDVTGFAFNFSRANREAVQDILDRRGQFGAGGIAVIDFDHDGFWDVLVTERSHATVLFKNDGKSGFIPTVLPEIKKPEDSARFYLWVDLDNDGKEELVGTKALKSKGVEAELGLYTWKSGRMTRLPGRLAFHTDRELSGMLFESATACDVNGDGLLDLVVAGYMHSASTRRDDEHRFSYVDGESGLMNLLFINQGGLRFKEESRERGIKESHFTFLVECNDFDGDGDVDLLFGNDFGKNDYFENVGGGRFKEDPTHPFHTHVGSTMGFSMADYDNTGEYAISLSNMYSHAGNRITALATDLSPEWRATLSNFAGGNALYRRRDGKWIDSAKELGLADAGWAWGNIFFDYDNDGDKDLYVVNGMTTHRDPSAPDY
jgi:hypothetical protein